VPPADERRASAIAGRGLFAGAAYVPGAGPVVVLDREVTTVADFGALNHSCDPNLAFVDARSLVARRAIEAGEELTVDYATALADPSFVLYCHCGSTRCRQAVEGTDWRIPQLQARYAGQWAPRVQALVDADTVGA